MKIYSCYTPSHEPLYRDYFAPSLPASLESVVYPMDIEGSGDFLTQRYLQCLRAKAEEIEASIRENDGQIIIWSDVDILFIRDPAPVIESLFHEDPRLDLAFQAEHRRGRFINGGFVAMRCSDRLAAFYRQVPPTMDQIPNWHDQDAIFYLLPRQSAIRWKTLPRTFAARSHGWPPPRNMILYHANCSPGSEGVEQKRRQFADLHAVRRHGQWGELATTLAHLPANVRWGLTVLRNRSQRLLRRLSRA